MRPDVCIIGLGPAGASAARELARSGLDVIAFEKKERAGFPVQCAEFVPALLDAGDLVISETSVQRIHEMITYVEEDAPDLTKNFSGHMIDRQAFDAALVDKAISAGAKCHFGVKLQRVASDGALIFANGQRIRPKMIIGADGPHSKIGRTIDSINHDIVETRQLSCKLLKPHIATDIYLSNQYPGGYGWMFPKGNVANIGIGVNRDNKDLLKPALESLHKHIVDKGMVGEDIFGYTGGAIPVGGMLEAVGKISDINVLLAGDAAGLANPITGAGIAAAVMSGRLAGEAGAAFFAGDVEALEIYEEDLQDLFGASLARAVRKRNALEKQRIRNKNLNRNELRAGWIAYDTYWQNAA